VPRLECAKRRQRRWTEFAAAKPAGIDRLGPRGQNALEALDERAARARAHSVKG
jgi:hypothetical protein